MTNRSMIHLLLGSAFLLCGCPRGPGSTYVPSSSVPVTDTRDGSSLAISLWETFVAINWPADVTGKKRGVPLSPNVPPTFSENLSAPRVWETWKQDFEVDGWDDKGKMLTKWGTYDINDSEPTPCKYFVQGPGHPPKKVVRSKSPIEPNEVIWPELYEQYGTVLTAIDTFKLFDPNRKEPCLIKSGPVIDVAGEYVRSEIRYNQAAYECLRDGQPNSQPNGCMVNRDEHIVVLPKVEMHSSGTEKVGAITLKASWRKVTGGIDNFQRYYTRTLLVVDYMKNPDPSGDPLVPVCRPQESALVGLHIVYKLDECKASNCTSKNNWAWATFEHVDNSVLCSKLSKVSARRLGFIPIPTKGFSYEPDPVSHVDLVVPHSGRAPVVLCRSHQIQDVASDENKDMKKGLGDYAPWYNYAMTGLQWPNASGVLDPPSGVANVTLEAYAQKSSCMQCHRGDRVKQTDFVWSLDPPAPNPPTCPPL